MWHSSPSFSTTFLENCESCGTTACHKIVVGVSKGMPAINIFPPTKPLLVSVEFHGDHMAVAMMRRIWSPTVYGILLDLKQRCLSLSSCKNSSTITEVTKKYKVGSGKNKVCYSAENCNYPSTDSSVMPKEQVHTH